jgi:hypothetical protein
MVSLVMVERQQLFVQTAQLYYLLVVAVELRLLMVEYKDLLLHTFKVLVVLFLYLVKLLQAQQHQVLLYLLEPRLMVVMELQEPIVVATTVELMVKLEATAEQVLVVALVVLHQALVQRGQTALTVVVAVVALHKPLLLVELLVAPAVLGL